MHLKSKTQIILPYQFFFSPNSQTKWINSVTCSALKPQGLTTLALGTLSGGISFFDLSASRNVYMPQEWSVGPVYDLMFHPVDSNLLISAHDQSSLGIINLTSFSLDQYFPAQAISAGSLTTISSCPEQDQLLLMGSDDGDLFVHWLDDRDESLTAPTSPTAESN
jgi:WD40 repeat protein